MTSDYHQLSRRATMSSGGGTVSDASDILARMNDRRGNDVVGGDGDDASFPSSSFVRPPCRRTYGRGKTSRGGDTGVTENDDDDDDNDNNAAKRVKRASLANVVGGVVVLRDRVSLFDHLQRLMCLLTWSDRHGGRWMGIRSFIDAYFSLLFQPYLGDSFKMNIIHVTNKRKICALFSQGTNGSYTILVMLNYPLWDRILNVSIALPNRYFRRSVRSRLSTTDVCETPLITAASSLSSSQFATFAEPSLHSSSSSPSSLSSSSSLQIEPIVIGDNNRSNNDNNALRSSSSSESFEAARRTPLFKLSIAALCLIDRLEYSMQIDRENVTFEHVVTLARFFSNSQSAKRLFRTGLSFQ